MTTELRNNIQGLTDFYSDLQNGTLPAVSFIKPDSVLDGHPGSSIPILYEAFLKKLVTSVQAQTELYQTTVIFITTDESGGTYDSGYIQPIDFFGDGPRIPLIAVSPYAKPGYIDHTYGDHASLLKFIEANWRLKPLSSRSRDNLPNPSANAGNPYVPANSPALGDLDDVRLHSPPGRHRGRGRFKWNQLRPQLTVIEIPFGKLRHLPLGGVRTAWSAQPFRSTFPDGCRLIFAGTRPGPARMPCCQKNSVRARDRLRGPSGWPREEIC